MISCACATRGLKDPRWRRAVGDQSSLPSREKMEEQWSLDARSSFRIPSFIQRRIEAALLCLVK